MSCIYLVKCVESGNGFKKGEKYPIVSFDNGINIANETSIECFATGCSGKGLYNPFDGSGKPSFDDYMSIELND